MDVEQWPHTHTQSVFARWPNASAATLFASRHTSDQRQQQPHRNTHNSHTRIVLCSLCVCFRAAAFGAVVAVVVCCDAVTV